MIFTLSKLFTSLLLPPGIFIISLFTASIFVKRFKILFFLTASIFLLLSTFFSNILLKPLENKKFPKNTKNPQAVVVLGGGSAPNDTYLPLSPTSTKRVLTALMVANKNSLPLIFSGYEGETAIKFLNNIGKNFNFKECKELKRGCFFIEAKSKDTYENAKFTRALFKKEPSVILVTSAYHMPRAYRLFRYFGFNITPIKADKRASKNSQNIWSYFITMQNLQKSYIALHEYVGLLSLYLRGVK